MTATLERDGPAAATPLDVPAALDALRAAAAAYRAADMEDAAARAAAVHEAAGELLALTHDDVTLAVAREILRPVRMTTAFNQQVRVARAARRRAAAHGRTPVNMTGTGFSFTMVNGSPADGFDLWREDDPDQPPRHAGRGPGLHNLVVSGEGAAREVVYLLSKDAASPRVPVPMEEIESGKYAARLGIPRSADRRIKDALATVILHHLAAGADEVAAYPSGDMRDDTGHLFIPVPEVLPDGYLARPPGITDAELADTGQAIAAIAARNPRMALARGFSVGSPYVSALGRQPFWVNLFGPGRRGKTITVLVAGSVWGRVRPPLPAPDSVLISWDATGKGPGRYLGQLGIVPAFFDETGTAEFAPAEWARIIYGITQGSSRLQAMQRGVGSRRTPGHRGVTFVTGNDMLCDGMAIGAFQGLPARLLQFGAPFTTSAAEAESLYPLLVRGYGYLGPAVLAAVTPDRMAELVAKAEADLAVPDSGVPRTIGQALALGVAGAMAADEITGGQPTAGAALEAAREYLGEHSGSPETDGERMLTVLADSLTYYKPAWASEQAARDLAKPYDLPGAIPRHGQEHKLRGYYDDEFLYVSSWAWKEIAEQEGAGSSAAARELYAAGSLHVPDSARRDRSGSKWQGWAPRWAGKGRAYLIRRDALPERGDEDQADDVSLCRSCGRPLDEERIRIGADVHFDCRDFAPAAPPPPEEEPPPACTVCDGPLDPALAAAGITMHVNCMPPDPGPPEPERASGPSAESGLSATGEVIAPAAPDASATGRREAIADVSRRKVFSANLQYETLERAMAAVDAGEPPERLRVLAALEGAHRDPGPFAPLRHGRQPFWAPELPAITEAARITEGWNFRRSGYSGPAAVLDRTGAYVASASSVVVAHGALRRGGAVGELPSSGLRPGYYLVTGYPWAEGGMPSPLGHVKPGAEVWVPAPTAALLRDLATAGRWPDASAADSFTGDPCRLRDWAHFVAELRGYALTRYGRDSGQYDTVKVAFGQALGLMLGSWAEGEAAPRRVWRCKCRRTDWVHHVKAQAGATLWRRADDCRQAAPGLPPLAIRNIDELVIPEAALELVTAAPAGGSAPVRVDQSGVMLGTFRVKAREMWGA